MYVDNPLAVPVADSPDRSSAGIGGPFQNPADDDDIDVPDADIIELEDGFSFGRETPRSDNFRPGEVFGSEALVEFSTVEATRSFLERSWLVALGEN